MKGFFKILALIVALMVAIVIIVPFILPVDAIFSQITTKVEQTTHRKLTLLGDKTLSIFPTLKLELNDVHLANMQSGSQVDMIYMKQLEVNIPWLSLLSGDLKLEKFVIIEPNILLEKNKAGEANWDLFSKVNENTQTTTSSTSDKSNKQISIPKDFDIQLGEVAIYGGKLTYLDATTKSAYEVNDLKLTIELPSLHQPLIIKGAVSYMSQTFALNTKISTPFKVITSQDFNLATTINSELVTLNFKGNIKEAHKVIEGTLDLQGNSLKNIIKWQNIPLIAKENAFNEFSFSGNMLFADEKINLANLNVKLDKLNIKGQSEIEIGGRVNINADIDLGMLDFNPYLPEENIKKETKVTIKTKAEPIVWDETKIDLSALTTFDADIKVKSIGLKLKDVKLGTNAFSVNLHKGIARIGMDKFNAYKGKGEGKVFINANKVPYTMETHFALTTIQAEPLLTDAIKLDKLSGSGSIDWQLKTKGNNQKQLMDNLNGRLGFNFEDGAIKGANIAAMVRSAEAMLKGDFSKTGLDKGFDKSQQTDFAKLSGMLNFQNGVGTNNDFKLFSPLMRVTGKGMVNLPKTKIDYGVSTGLVSSIEGQGTKSRATGFKVPVRVKGPFHDINIKLDISSASKDKLKNKVKDKFKKLFG